jgi:hypothetical protein
MFNKCPFNQGPCNNECALFAEGINKCTFVGIAMLLEDLQKIGVVLYERTMREKIIEEDMAAIKEEKPEK